MAKKIVLKVTVYDDGSADISRGPDCGPTRPTGGKRKARKKSTKKKSSSG